MKTCGECAHFKQLDGRPLGESNAILWYLAEGTTRPGFDEWVLVLNPSNATVQAGVTFQTPSGQVGGPTLSLPPQTRQTVHVNDYIQNKDVSTQVTSLTAGLGVVAERSMYIRTADGKVDSHNSIGATETNSGWGLAEGATWPGFEEWVLVQNPTATPASAQFYFLTPDGVTEGPNEYVGPWQRVTVRVNDYMPDSDVSTLVFTEDDTQKVVVERAMYIRAPDGKLGATNSIASLYSSTGWFLPEGCTSQGFDEWVLVMNPSPEDTVLVQLMFMTPRGSVSGPSALLFPAQRETFHVNDYVTGDVSTLVESDGYVLAERSMYVRTADGKNGAHCSLGLLPTSTEGAGGGMAASLTPKEISRLRTVYSSK